jgi:hypothetical protein
MRELGLPDTDLGRAVADFMTLIESSEGPRALPPEIHAVATDAARELTAVYRRLDPHRHMDRWRVVRGIGMLRSDAVAADLVDIAMEPPPVHAHPPGKHAGCGTADGEGMIRLRAAEGLRSIAEAGGADARRGLLTAMRAPSLSVRRAAVQGYLSLPGATPTLLADVRERLAPEDYWMASVRAGTPEEFTGTPDVPTAAPGGNPVRQETTTSVTE